MRGFHRTLNTMKPLKLVSPFTLELVSAFYIAIIVRGASYGNAQAPSAAPAPPCSGGLGVPWIVNAWSQHRAVSAIPPDQQQQYFGTFMVGN